MQVSGTWLDNKLIPPNDKIPGLDPSLIMNWCTQVDLERLGLSGDIEARPNIEQALETVPRVFSEKFANSIATPKRIYRGNLLTDITGYHDRIQ